MKTIAIYLSLYLSILLKTTAGQNLISIEFKNADLNYQVSITTGTNTVEYDEMALRPQTRGMSPRAIAAYLRTQNGKDVDTHQPLNGYSSWWMSSGSPFHRPKFTAINLNTTYQSESCSLAVVLRGLEHHLSLEQVESIAEVRLDCQLRLRVNGAEADHKAESKWTPFPDSLRKELKERVLTITKEMPKE